MDPDTVVTPDPTPSPLDALDAGIAATEAPAAATDNPLADAPLDAAPEAVTPDATKDTPPEGDKPADPPVDEAKPEGDKPADAKPDAAKDAAPEPNEAVEKEIADRGLKGKTADRFRELSAEVAAAAPLREALTAAGIKTPEDLTEQLKWVANGKDLIDTVMRTGANPEQYGMALDALALVNKGMAGDAEAAEQYFKIIEGEYLTMAKFLGKEVAGVDLLADHPDLAQKVADLDVTREAAVELAKHRNAQKSRTQATEAVQQQTAQQQATAAGVQSLNALGKELHTADPEGYAAKEPFLLATVATIKANLPPDKWEAATREAYARMPTLPKVAPVVAAPAAKPVPGPVRATGPRPTLTPTFDDPMKALEAGIAGGGA